MSACNALLPLLPLYLLQSPDWYDEAAVGAGLAASKAPRDQLFLISKIHPRDFGKDATMAAITRSLQHFNSSYLDMLLLHYPSCTPGTKCVPQPDKVWQDSWRALEDAVQTGLVHSIGEYHAWGPSSTLC